MARRSDGVTDSSSRIAITLDQVLQSIARTLNAHLERRDADARDGGHLVVAELLDVLEEKRLALRRIELGHRAFDRQPQLRIRRRALHLRALHRGIVEDDARR